MHAPLFPPLRQMWIWFTIDEPQELLQLESLMTGISASIRSDGMDAVMSHRINFIKITKVWEYINKRSMGPVSLTSFHLQNCLKVLLYQRLYFNKLESPCPNDTPCQISMHSGEWFMRKFIKILLIQSLYLNKSECPFPKHVSCQLWLKLA